MDPKKDKISKLVLTVWGSRTDLDKIEVEFEWLKRELKISKTELYKEALLWISTYEPVKKQFKAYLWDKKYKNIFDEDY